MRREQGASDNPTLWAISTLLARAFSTSACRILRSNASIAGGAWRFARLPAGRRICAVFLRIFPLRQHKIALASPLAQKIARKAQVQFHRIIPISIRAEPAFRPERFGDGRLQCM